MKAHEGGAAYQRGFRENVDEVRQRLAEGEDIDGWDEMGRTALMQALFGVGKKDKVIACMIENGADKDVEGQGGHSPASVAAMTRIPLL